MVGRDNSFIELFAEARTQEGDNNLQNQIITQKKRDRPRKEINPSISNVLIGQTDYGDIDKAIKCWNIGQAVGMRSATSDQVLQSLRRSQRKAPRP